MALVAYRPGNSCSEDVVVREQLMVERRKDQERHSHKQIWTKKPHGGPYVKAKDVFHKHSSECKTQVYIELFIASSVTSEEATMLLWTAQMGGPCLLLSATKDRSGVRPPTLSATT